MMTISRKGIIKEIGYTDMSHEKDSDERYQMDKNDEERVTNDTEVFKLGKFSSQKNTDNVAKKYHERNKMDMIDDEESDE